MHTFIVNSREDIVLPGLPASAMMMWVKRHSRAQRMVVYNWCLCSGVVLFSKGIDEESSTKMSWLSRARRNDIRFICPVPGMEKA
jgi:hypothetical protein